MAMTARELAEQLLEHPDRLVVMAKDAEGNGYSPLEDTWLTRYAPETTWSGETEHPDEPWDDDYPGAVPAIVLWPVN